MWLVGLANIKKHFVVPKLKSDRRLGIKWEDKLLAHGMAEIIMSKSCIPHNTKKIQKEGEKKFQLKYLFEEIYCQDIQPFML